MRTIIAGGGERRRPVAAAAGVAVLAALLGACQSAPRRDPDFATVRPPVPVRTAATPGAIYQAGHDMVLFEDLRARRVGDILTVLLVEQTDASKSAETTTERSNDTSVTNPTVLGTSVRFDAPGFLPISSIRDNNLAASLSSSNDFSGKGESKQSNKVTGEIAVTVAEVLPNGNLVVQGEKLFSLNQGSEHVRFSGVVRPADIGSDNTVASNRVAGARIIYGGEGAVASSNVVGWLARFFTSAIFPF